MTQGKNVFRPRLRTSELHLIQQALEAYIKLMQQKRVEMEERDHRIFMLRHKMLRTGPYSVYKELRHERELYRKDKEADYRRKERFAASLLRRFKAMVKGGRLHTDIFLV